MDDETYALPAEPAYQESIRRLRNTDPVDASAVLNPLIQALIENTHFVKLLAEAIAAQNTVDHAAIRQETAQRIGAAIAAIPTPDVSGQIADHDGAASAHAALFQTLDETLTQALSTHAGRQDNPHGVTAGQIGASAADHTHTAGDVGALPISGGTVTGPLSVPEPMADAHAATKKYADGLVNGTAWAEASALPSSASWKTICYGNGKFVALADSRKAAYSTDGITWTETVLPGLANWYGVTYGNGKFMAVAGNYKRAAYSTDGIAWTAATMPTAAEWYSVAYGGGKFVAVASNSNQAAYCQQNTVPPAFFEAALEKVNPDWMQL